VPGEHNITKDIEVPFERIELNKTSEVLNFTVVVPGEIKTEEEIEAMERVESPVQGEELETGKGIIISNLEGLETEPLKISITPNRSSQTITHNESSMDVSPIHVIPESIPTVQNETITLRSPELEIYNITSAATIQGKTS